MRVAYFVSDHGWGHLNRSTVIARAILARGHALQMAVAPAMKDAVRESLPKAAVATGVLDRGYAFGAGGRGADAGRTRELLAAAVKMDTKVRNAVRAWKPDVVLADATPWASEVARAIGVPSAICSNFSWDDQYVALFASDSRAGREVDAVRAHVAGFTVALELPLGPGVPTAKERRAVGLVARRPSGMPLGVPVDRPLVVWAFGRTPVEEQPTEALRALAEMCEEHGFRLVAGEAVAGVLDENVTPVSEEVAWPDLLAAARLVVTKTGYSTVAETLRGRGYVAALGITGLPEERAMLAQIEAGGYGLGIPLADPSPTEALLSHAETLLARAPREAIAEGGEAAVVDALEELVGASAASVPSSEKRSG